MKNILKYNYKLYVNYKLFIMNWLIPYNIIL